MKKLFQTLDGKIFDNEVLALEHEALLEKDVISPRLLRLEKERAITEFKDGDIICAGRNFDEAGNSRGFDKLSGKKVDVMRFIAANNKYWNIGNQLELSLFKDDIIKV